ncbi:S8 family serine peptidase [Candidatus Electronema sp. JC]|uniref:S8 family serine peptidase n=1 Tax=Candidatus Electronema sp. JC TaxID=3401570 RepID=UPI003B43A0AF
MPEKEYEVIGHVSPRSLGPRSLFASDTTITAKNIDEFRSDAADVRDAKRALTEAGFHVFEEGSSDTTISIGGTAKLFQEFFNAHLTTRSTENSHGNEVSFFSAAADENGTEVMNAPGELAQLIEGVVIARPPIYFSASPLPPIAQIHSSAYRYLFVPDEVAVILKAARVHRLGITGKNVVVGMIDTGFFRHPFFSWRGYRVLDTLLGPGAVNQNEDINGHGTGESANIFSCAPDCRLRPVKAGNDAVGAINTALNSSPKPQILTNSWGYNVDRNGLIPDWLKPLEAAVANAVASGVTVCFSAGNGHYGFPGSHPDVISVGGVHVNYPGLELEASSYASSFVSSFYPGRRVPDLCGLTGKRVDINGGKAPSIMLPVQEGAQLDGIEPSTGAANDGWGLFSGTSAACPQIAGICALMLEKDPNLTPVQVKQKLISSARDVTAGTTHMGDAAGPGNDLATGAGLADAKWAYLKTMGDVAAAFFAASKEEQISMMHSGAMPEVPKEFIDDLIDTLRSR